MPYAPSSSQNSNAPECAVHGVPMRARSGQYGPFWSCGQKDNGQWCRYKPPRSVQPPTQDDIFSGSLDKMTGDDKRSKDISWMNAKNNATLIVQSLIQSGTVSPDKNVIIDEIHDIAKTIHDLQP